MAFTKQNVRDAATALVQDDASYISSGELDIFINSALQRLNVDRPLVKVKDISGDGTQDYALPAEYVKGFSDIDTVEVPAGETPPRYVDRDDDWFVYEDPTKGAGLQNRLRFRETTPATGESVRVVILSPHVVPDSGDSTLDETAFLALQYMTVCLYFRSLGARFGQTTDSTIAADAVDYGGRTQNFLFLAERYQTSYNGVLGLNAKLKPAQALREADVVFGHGEDMIFHPARRR